MEIIIIDLKNINSLKKFHLKEFLKKEEYVYEEVYK